jgi:hypothetical protein
MDTVERTSSSADVPNAHVRRPEGQPGPPLTEGSSPTWILPATVGDEHYLILANFDSGCAEVVLAEIARSISGK